MKYFMTHVDMDIFFRILVCGTRAQSLSALFSSSVYNTDLSPFASVGFIACLVVYNMAAALKNDNHTRYSCCC
jgi:hypothetical protein